MTISTVSPGGPRKLRGREAAHVAAAAAMASGAGVAASMLAPSAPAGATATTGWTYANASQGTTYYCNKATVSESGTQPEFYTGVESGSTHCSSDQQLAAGYLGAAVWAVLNGSPCFSSGYFTDSTTASSYGFTDPACGGQHGNFQSMAVNEYWYKAALEYASTGEALTAAQSY